LTKEESTDEQHTAKKSLQTPLYIFSVLVNLLVIALILIGALQLGHGGDHPPDPAEG
jgi:hypothetical protein